MGGVVLAIAAAGVLVLRRQSVDEESRRLVPPALDRMVAALPPGSILIEKATRLTSNNYKTLGRVVFVSPVAGADALATLSRALGWSQCEGGVLRSIPCGAPRQTGTLLAGFQSFSLGGGGRDDVRFLLGDRVDEFPAGTVVVEVLVNTE